MTFTRDNSIVPLISCRNVCKYYPMGGEVVHALDHVSFDIEAGEFLSVMGPSGSGKSTLMNLIGALDTPTSGELLVDSRNLAQLSKDELAELRNSQIGFVFQQFNLLARTTALENVKLPMLYSDKSHADINERAHQCLELVGLADRSDHQPAQLSGGQQQRVAIARALANEPSLILADEPTGALDSNTSAEILELFQRLNKTGMTVIVVTHEANVAQICRRHLVFLDGKLVGDESEISSHGLVS